jgi:hypothetical protein
MSESIEWMFIVGEAPWWGGFWERLTKLTKDCVEKVVAWSRCSDFWRTKNIVNRSGSCCQFSSVVYAYDDVDGTSYALSPAHLMYGRRITACQNEENYEVISTHESFTKRARHHQRLLRQFTKQWKHECLTSLRENAEKNLSTLCRKSWVFSGFLPQGKLTGWVRINTVRKVISQLL